MASALRKGAQFVCSRAQRGLFAGKTVRFGNNVSEDGGNRCAALQTTRAERAAGSFSQAHGSDSAHARFSHALRLRFSAPRSTRRNWKPNAQRKRVFSELLGRMLPLSLTTHTLRCIDKAGGARQRTHTRIRQP
jgi:large subunit ribosomal protein L28